MNKKVKIERGSDGKMKIDFSGFSENSCGREDTKIRLLLNAFGLKTEEVESEPKKEKEPNPTKARQTQTN